jgi:glyoxylase-like metal-dependent hydrolase (beta-lactamase superfamily II)
MTLDTFTGGFVATNGYLLQKDDTTLLIDAPAGIADWLSEKSITPDHLLLTHQHFDHVEDAARFACPIHAFADFSRELILDQGARAMGLSVHVDEFTISEVLSGQSALTLGAFEIDLLHLPGHSPDSIVFSLPGEQLAIVGDTLFAGGVGRSDLPGGDEQQLFTGIREKLLTLPGDTQLYPGHGPATSPEGERGNPFLH